MGKNSCPCGRGPDSPRARVLAHATQYAGYCQSYARWREAEEWITEHGIAYPIKDEKGNVKSLQQFPQVAVARNHLLILKAYQQEFGLTPSARTRLHESGVRPNDDLDDFLDQNAR